MNTADSCASAPNVTDKTLKNLAAALGKASKLNSVTLIVFGYSPSDVTLIHHVAGSFLRNQYANSVTFWSAGSSRTCSAHFLSVHTKIRSIRRSNRSTAYDSLAQSFISESKLSSLKERSSFCSSLGSSGLCLQMSASSWIEDLGRWDYNDKRIYDEFLLRQRFLCVS